MLETAVYKVTRREGGFNLDTSHGAFCAKIVINAAGLIRRCFHNLVSMNKIKITPRKGEYCLFGQQYRSYRYRPPCSSARQYGQGVLVTPTVHGNILIGPTAENINDKEGVDTTAQGIAELTDKALLSVPVFP